jgi:hypothetical protein
MLSISALTKTVINHKMIMRKDLKVLNQEMLTNKAIKILTAVTHQEGPNNHLMVETGVEMIREKMVEVDSTQTIRTEIIIARIEEMSIQTLLLKSTSPKFLDHMVRRTLRIISQSLERSKTSQ